MCNTIATKVCSGDFVNFFKTFYCDFDGQLWAQILLMVVLIFLIFKYTAIAVDEYIAEGITIISDALNFSNALSAVTLLALANGAGDVITALVAGSSPGGVSYNIGALYGAGLFVAAMVVAMCILKEGKPIQFDSMIIYRDVGFYIISTVTTIIFAVFGEINVIEAVVLLLLYVALVMVVVIQEKCEKKKAEKESLESGSLKGQTRLAGLLEGFKNKSNVQGELEEPIQDGEKGEEEVEKQKAKGEEEIKKQIAKEEKKTISIVEEKPENEEEGKLVPEDEKNYLKQFGSDNKQVVHDEDAIKNFLKAFTHIAIGQLLKEKLNIKRENRK